MLFKGQLYLELSLERYILKILTDDLWVVGWGNDMGMPKERSYGFVKIMCCFYNFKNCKVISFLCRHIGQRPPALSCGICNCIVNFCLLFFKKFILFEISFFFLSVRVRYPPCASAHDSYLTFSLNETKLNVSKPGTAVSNPIGHQSHHI